MLPKLLPDRPDFLDCPADALDTLFMSAARVDINYIAVARR